MEFENTSDIQVSPTSGCSEPEFGGFEMTKQTQNRQYRSSNFLQRVGYEELFGSALIDFRLANDVYNRVPNKDYCDTLPKAKTIQESLESTAKGNSTLNRMYEIAVQVPEGKTEPKDFEKVFGKANAEKMDSMGVISINKHKDSAVLELKRPLQLGDTSNYVEIDRTITYDVSINGSSVSIDKLTGVTGHKGFFSVPIESLEMQPRQDGYLSARMAAAMFSKENSSNNPLLGQEIRICAFPNGKIFH